MQFIRVYFIDNALFSFPNLLFKTWASLKLVVSWHENITIVRKRENTQSKLNMRKTEAVTESIDWFQESGPLCCIWNWDLLKETDFYLENSEEETEAQGKSVLGFKQL